MNKTLIFAHRGSAGTHPENTMDAFQAALDAGADGIELDVQLTKDFIPVVIHDETVERTTNGTGWVKDLTLAELQQLDAGSWFSPSFSTARIPTLQEVLQWVSGTQLILNIELKNGIVRYPDIEKKVLELVEQFNLMDRVIISSFNHYSLVEINQLNSEIETAILFMEGLYEPWNYAKGIGASGLHCFLAVAVPELIIGAAKAGTPVRPFTVNEDHHIQALISGGCSAIITDWPEKAFKIRTTMTER
ncbi:glycerophosphodiester phosphodiesterase [Anaerobacillus alkaliphilus]|uniref:Glycerophosphodiester phosphodiesterase n=1 Tax=Anaerobacillus alkaliphilus TaxID=1548597 RepID=A0A4Q0VNQ7_9BACI|nr:glycerophosphodiester phosphodiesterase [Anaerobacillus alkaliphilus]RXI97798.1 glycerophosphodiester phosphodiesterase [Anaerobacillus alkaliphilus]